MRNEALIRILERILEPAANKKTGLSVRELKQLIKVRRVPTLYALVQRYKECGLLVPGGSHGDKGRPRQLYYFADKGQRLLVFLDEIKKLMKEMSRQLL